MRQIFVNIILICCSTMLFAQQCPDNFQNLIPITDLGTGTFNNHVGGKYPNGNNAIPLKHYQQGIQVTSEIQPLNSAGQADSISGKIGFMVLGYSTAAMTGRFVREMIDVTPHHPALQFMIGAQGGRDINSMTDSNSTYWTVIDSALDENELTRAQIQIIWLSSGDILSYQLGFEEQCANGVAKYRQMLLNIKKYYPNCKLVLISDRTYAGYIGNENRGPKELAEPTAYYNGWTVKWLIEKQIMNESGYDYQTIPFIDWGPYLWTDGTKGNKAGYKWLCDDAGKGGIHPSSKGRMKEAALVYLYFKQHPYMSRYFN
jgi:hypothetical protein